MKIEKSSHLISGTLRAITQNFVRTLLGLSVATVFISNPVSASNSVSTGHAQTLPEANQALKMNWKNVRTQEITTGGITFAYRELGEHNNGTPIVFLAHLAAVLDNWDPRVMDGIAAKHHAKRPVRGVFVSHRPTPCQRPQNRKLIWPDNCPRWHADAPRATQRPAGWTLKTSKIIHIIISPFFLSSNNLAVISSGAAFVGCRVFLHLPSQEPL